MKIKVNSIVNNLDMKVLTYMNIRISRLCFLLKKDILNYRDINLVSFFNCGCLYFFINIYSDDQQSTLKYLKDTKANLNNVLIIMEDFNIRNNN